MKPTSSRIRVAPQSGQSPHRYDRLVVRPATDQDLLWEQHGKPHFINRAAFLAHGHGRDSKDASLWMRSWWWQLLDWIRQLGS